MLQLMLWRIAIVLIILGAVRYLAEGGNFSTAIIGAIVLAAIAWVFIYCSWTAIAIIAIIVIVVLVVFSLLARA